MAAAAAAALLAQTRVRSAPQGLSMGGLRSPSAAKAAGAVHLSLTVAAGGGGGQQDSQQQDGPLSDQHGEEAL